MPRHGSILVIDDEEIMREILQTLLAREGYSVRLASSGTQGIELAKSLPFDGSAVAMSSRRARITVLSPMISERAESRARRSTFSRWRRPC